MWVVWCFIYTEILETPQWLTLSIDCIQQQISLISSLSNSVFSWQTYMIQPWFLPQKVSFDNCISWNIWRDSRMVAILQCCASWEATLSIQADALAKQALNTIREMPLYYCKPFNGSAIWIMNELKTWITKVAYYLTALKLLILDGTTRPFGYNDADYQLGIPQKSFQ